MIYFDNSATLWPKPESTKKAIMEALQQVGNPGRGAHALAVWSSVKVYEVREKIAKLFNINDPLRVAFTMNATHSLNIAVGLCYGQIVTTSMDHNSVLRPCFKRGYYTVVNAQPDGDIPPKSVISKITELTGAVIMTHASNVTGQIYDIYDIADYCHRKKILFILDCAQSAGVTDIDVDAMHIDVLCFTGHKGLLGVQGTGGIYCAPHVRTRPYMCGGTGGNSFDMTHPDKMPECFEAGTVNTHGIAALGGGIDYINSMGIKAIHEKESKLRSYLVKRLREIKGVRIYGNERSGVCHTGAVSVNIDGYDPAFISTYLAKNMICVRSGFHCAPLAHKTIGTQDTGTVRFGLSQFNTTKEIDTCIEYLKKIDSAYEK